MFSFGYSVISCSHLLQIHHVRPFSLFFLTLHAIWAAGNSPVHSHYIVPCKHLPFAHAVQPTFLHSCVATLLPTPHTIYQSLPPHASNTYPCYMQCPQICPHSPAFQWACTPILPEQIKDELCSGHKESLCSQMQSTEATLLTNSPDSTGDVSVPFPGTYGEEEDDWRGIPPSWFHHSGIAVCLGAEAVA